MILVLQKYAEGAAQRRASSQKFQVLNIAVLSTSSGFTLKIARQDTIFWGRIVESAMGTHLATTLASEICEMFYWRDRNREVDFAVCLGKTLSAIEVKSGPSQESLVGMEAFANEFKLLLVGENGIGAEDFSSKLVEH